MIRSAVSLVKTMICCSFSFLITSIIAISVIEFFEKSPEKNTRSEFSAKFSSVVDFAKEPESVDSAKYIVEKVGNFF